MKTKKETLHWVLERFKEGKLNPETTMKLVELLYDPKITYPQFQRIMREETGDIMPP